MNANTVACHECSKQFLRENRRLRSQPLQLGLGWILFDGASGSNRVTSCLYG